MSQHIGQLLESGKGTDVTFEVGWGSFAAHKWFLAASRLFSGSAFWSNENKNMQCIKVEDMDAPVFKL
ncbi:BTB/POZ and MATH domain-containing protein 2 [Ananas comosus]|uniref:BTB/POZ and MATH domain-containing protein 2 n=1 Tax=Ananas comosus TaxID=4615 RepID=A0A199VT26_ANACO|nr:BTB/POZ and MATH domain-containing protein 2 [Ananas comosus]